MLAAVFRVAGALILANVAATGAAAQAVNKIASTGDVHVAYRSEGQGDAIILLPSVGRGADDFIELSALLTKRGFRVLLPEPRGIGESKGPMSGLTLHDLARDVIAVIEAEGIRRVVVGGHAYGNWVARVVAVDRPDLVRGVMVIAAAAKGPIPTDLGQSITKAADPSLPEAERIEHLRRVFFAPHSDPRPFLTGWSRATREAQRAAAQATPQSGWWHAGVAPILELQAGTDPLMPAARAHELKAELGARVKVEVIANTSHALVPEAPVEVADAIARFVGGLPP